jgi:hypothetical protein
MAKTFYKYAERDVANQVDWLKISRDLNKSLEDEVKAREEKKKEIDDTTNKVLDDLLKAPTGVDEKANEKILSYASQAQERMLDLDKKLKSGKIGLKEYNLVKQNIIRSTKSFFTAAEAYNKNKKEGFDRMNSGKSQLAEIEDRARYEAFANMANVEPVIGPDGTLVLMKQKKDENGNLVPTNEMATPYDLMNLSTSIKDRYMTDESVGKFVKTVGDYVAKEDKTGGWSLTSDPTRRKQYEVYENAFIDTVLNDPWSASSILTEDIKIVNGKPISYAYSESEAMSPEKILRKKTDENSRDLIPQVTDEQKNVVRQFLKDKIRGQLEIKETFTSTPKETPYRPTEAEIERKDNAAKIQNKANMIGNLYSGTDEEIETSMTFFRDKSNVRKVQRTPNAIIVTTVDKDGNSTTRDIPFRTKDGNLISKENWIKSASSALLGEDIDPNVAAKAANATKGKDFNEVYTGTRSIETPEKTPVVNLNTKVVTGDTKATALAWAKALKNEGLWVDFNEEKGSITIREGSQSVRGRDVAKFNIKTDSDDKLKAVEFEVYSYMKSRREKQQQQGQGGGGVNYEEF